MAKRRLSPFVAPVTGGGVEPSLPGIDPAAMLLAMRATGADFLDSLQTVLRASRQALGCLKDFQLDQNPQVVEWGVQTLREANAVEDLGRVLWDFLDLESNLANKAFGQCVGLEVADCLDLESRSALRVLPDGLQVRRNLVLDECSSLRRLPENLKVGGEIWMENCSSWDERIPASARIKGQIYCDFHPYQKGGISLRTWRRRYGEGF